MPRCFLAALAALALLGVAPALVTGCDGTGDSRDSGDVGATTRATPPPSTSAPSSPPSSAGSTTTTPPIGNLDAARITTRPVARLDAPLAMATDRAGRRYVAEQGGRVVRVGDDGTTETVLDISDDVEAGGEQGLLGLAFSPDGRWLVVHYSDRASGGDTRVVAFPVTAGGIDAGSGRTLLAVDQPQPNHNGGTVAFGPDGLLYLGLGDGGAGGDRGPGHPPEGNGQSVDTLLGKIVRIEPTPDAAEPYRIPPGNPFAGGGGAPEIFALGLRNPWRFSFDRATGDLWIGDVGQNKLEEIDFVPAGEGAGWNFGWNVWEGSRRYRDGDAPGAVGPIFEYGHDGACAVVGGYVYRGRAIPELAGAYVFADNCDGTLRALQRQADGSLVTRDDLGVSVDSISSFGEDESGELYVLSLDGTVARIEPA